LLKITASSAADLMIIQTNSAALFQHNICLVNTYNHVESGNVLGNIELDKSDFGGHRKGKKVEAVDKIVI
jgi:transposase